MTEREVTGGELGRRIGMRRGSVSKLTRGLVQPTVENLARIAAALELTSKELLWLLNLEVTNSSHKLVRSVGAQSAA